MAGFGAPITGRFCAPADSIVRDDFPIVDLFNRRNGGFWPKSAIKIKS
jgi:hypothetical protein